MGCTGWVQDTQIQYDLLFSGFSMVLDPTVNLKVQLSSKFD